MSFTFPDLLYNFTSLLEPHVATQLTDKSPAVDSDPNDKFPTTVCQVADGLTSCPFNKEMAHPIDHFLSFALEPMFWCTPQVCRTICHQQKTAFLNSYNLQQYMDQREQKTRIHCFTTKHIKRNTTRSVLNYPHPLEKNTAQKCDITQVDHEARCRAVFSIYSVLPV